MKKPTEQERAFIREAVQTLEFPSFVTRVTNVLGKPIEAGIAALPAKAREIVETTSRKSIEAALTAAVKTVPGAKQNHDFQTACDKSSKMGGVHTAGTAVTGALGGFFGLPAVMAELPVTTVVMLRSMAHIASLFGEDLSDPKTQLETLYLFGMGGPTPGDDSMESSYYLTRVTLSRMIDKAAHFVVGKSIQEIAKALSGRGALMEFIVKVASRFEVVAGEKAVGQMLPGLGAGAGALLNIAFTEHFNHVARSHFGLKRLEREYGAGQVKSWYELARKEIISSRR